MSHMTCPPGNTLPVFGALPIPANITTVFIPGSNASGAAMTACCAPNPVDMAAGCYEWCEVPRSRLHNSWQVQIEGDFISCLGSNGRNFSQSNILGVHVASAAGRFTVAGPGMWVLFVGVFGR